MFRILLILFIVTPIAEFSLLYYMSDWIGLLPTVILVLVTGVVGASLAKAQGYQTWRRIQQELSQGQMPSSALLDALMIFLAGALLITPGILTDAFGFSLLIPQCRAFYKGLARKYFLAHFEVHGMNMPPGDQSHRPRHSQIIDSYVVEESSDEAEPIDGKRP